MSFSLSEASSQPSHPYWTHTGILLTADQPLETHGKNSQAFVYWDHLINTQQAMVVKGHKELLGIHGLMG